MKILLYLVGNLLKTITTKLPQEKRDSTLAYVFVSLKSSYKHVYFWKNFQKGFNTLTTLENNT